jgi:hypothetical protein
MPSSQYQYSLKFFRGTTGAYVVADATPDADRTLRLQSTVPHYSQSHTQPWVIFTNILHGRALRDDMI